MRDTGFWKKIIGMTCMAVCVLGYGSTAKADSENCLNYYYSTTDNGWGIKGYTPSDNAKKDKLIVPDSFEYTINGVFYEGPVLGVQKSALANYQFERIHFKSKELLGIGEKAFQGSEVNGGWSGNNDDNYGYSGSVVFLGEVREIGKYAFQGMTVKKGSLNFSKYAGSVVFKGDVGTIEAYAFADIDLGSSLEFQGKIDTIGDYAMSNMTLGEGLKGEYVRVIGKGALSNNDITKWYGVKGLESVGEKAFENCTKLPEMEFPDTVTEIGADCFKGCESLALVTLPDNSDLTIGENAFPNNKNMTIVIPSKLTDISNYSFETLTNVVFQVNVNCDTAVLQYLEENELQYKEGADGEIKRGSGNSSEGEENPSGGEEKNPSGGKEEDPSGGKEENPSGGKEENPSGGKEENPSGGKEENPSGGKEENPSGGEGDNPSGGGQAGGSTSGGTQTEATENPVVTEKPEKGRTYIVENLEYKVTDSATVTFMGPVDKKIKKLTVPSTVNILGKKYKVTRINAKACYNCKNLATVSVGNNVTEVEEQAFAKCGKLKTVTLGMGLEKLGKKTFYQDKKLKQITIKGIRLKSVGKYTLRGVKKVSIKVPKKKKEVYQNLFKKAK